MENIEIEESNSQKNDIQNIEVQQIQEILIPMQKSLECTIW